MNQVSLSDIVTGAWEEIKAYVLQVLKEAVGVMLLEEQNKVLGRGKYERGGSGGVEMKLQTEEELHAPLGQP